MGHEDRIASIDAFLESLSSNATESKENLAAAIAGKGHDHHHGHHGAHDHSFHGVPTAHVHGDGGHDTHAGHMMKMWFHGGVEEVILFDFWRINSWCGMIFSCILIFIMGAAYEGIKWFRVYLQMQQSVAQKKTCHKENNHEVLPLQNCQVKRANSQEDVYNPTTTPPTNARNTNRTSPFNAESPFATSRLIQAVLYIVQLVLAYWLMLIVMTYNNYLTAAVILGAGFGHWLFAVLKFRSPLGETADSFATDACH